MADSYNELFGLGTYSVDASLVAWFKLQDDPASSALDSSGNSVSATVLGDPTSAASSGFLAKHFVLDGIDDGVDLGRPAALQLESGPLTILARAYNSTGGKSLITMGTSRSSASNRTFDLFDNGSQFRFQGLRPAGASWTAQTTTRPSLNAWHNYAATWDGTTDSNAAKLYVDNSLAAQATPISSSLTTGHNWYLGGYQPTSTQFEWNGNAKDFALFSRVLTAAEIGHWDSGPEPVNTVANSLNDDGTGSVGSWDSQGNGTITYLTTLYDASDDSSVATSTAASFDFSGDITGGETYYAVTVASNDGGSASAENQTTADVTMAGGGGGQTITVGQASDTESALTPTVLNPRIYNVGQPLENDTTLPSIVFSPRTIVTGQAEETDLVLSATVEQDQQVVLGQAVEDSTALSTQVINPRTYTTGQSTETDNALSATVNSDSVVNVGIAVESDELLTAVVENPRTYTLGQTEETDTVQQVVVENPKTVLLGTAVESCLAVAATIEQGKIVSLGLATELSESLTITINNPRTITLAQTSENDLAISVNVIGSGTNLIIPYYYHLLS